MCGLAIWRSLKEMIQNVEDRQAEAHSACSGNANFQRTSSSSSQLFRIYF